MAGFLPCMVGNLRRLVLSPRKWLDRNLFYAEPYNLKYREEEREMIPCSDYGDDCLEFVGGWLTRDNGYISVQADLPAYIVASDTDILKGLQAMSAVLLP